MTAIESSAKVGYQGVPGARSGDALRALEQRARLIAYETLRDVFGALASGDVDLAFVAIENSRGGSVAEAYELLLEQPVIVVAEYLDRESNGSESQHGQATRYWMLAPGEWSADKESPEQGAGKTSIVFAVEDKPGALVRALSSFSRQQINLKRLESRPAHNHSWEYLFFMDVEGYAHEPRLRAALRELTRLNPFMRVLGSYPEAPDPRRDREV